MVSRKTWVMALCIVAAIVAPFPVAAIYSQASGATGIGTNCACTCCMNNTCDCGNCGQAGDTEGTGSSGCCIDRSCDSNGPCCDMFACFRNTSCTTNCCAADCTTRSGYCVGTCCGQPPTPAVQIHVPPAQASYTGNILLTQRPVSVASTRGCCQALRNKK